MGQRESQGFGGWPLLRGLAGEKDGLWKTDQHSEEPAAAPEGRWVLTLPRTCSGASGLTAGGGDADTASEPVNAVPWPVSQNSSAEFAVMRAPRGLCL